MPDSRTTYWEQFAQDSAESYIQTPRNQRNIDRDEFEKRGYECARKILSESQPYRNGNDLVVEYGCGVGRLLIPMASEFRSAVGIDVSPTMLEKLKDASLEKKRDNVSGALSTDPWEENLEADLVYSWMVFQHIESTDVINTALYKIRSALKPDSGVAYLQFDVRPRTLAYRLRSIMPDSLLPRFSRKGIRCIRRSPEEIRGMLQGARLSIMEERMDPPKKMVFLVRAPSSS
jgi:SAM-dependent methyltransferase